MKRTLSDYLQIWGFESDMVIFSDGSYGFGLKLSPLDAGCWSNSQMNEFASGVRQFLNGLPEQVDLQFVQDIGAGNQEVIERHSSYAVNSLSNVVRELTASRIERLSRLDAEGRLPRHALRLFVRRRPGANLLEKPKLFSKTADFVQISEDRLKSDLGAMERFRSDLTLSLRNLGLAVEFEAADSIVDLIYAQWNPTRRVLRSGFDPNDVRHSLLFTDAAISDRGFTLGGMHYRVISLKLLPDQTFSTMASCLRDLPFDSRLQLTIHSPSQQQELEALQLQRRMAYSMIAGRRSGVSDLDTEAKFRDLESLLEQMVAEGEKVFHFGLQVILKSTDPALLDDYVSQTLLKLRELSGAEGMEESLAAFNIFAQAAIPNARCKERVRRIKTSNLADLLPLYGPWQGHAEPKILLRTRYGSLTGFNPFSGTLTNFNQVVSGGSGSGKSFLTNLLLTQMLNENPKVFIVDIGGSYRKICDNLNGQYLPLGMDGDFSINPFDLAQGESAPSNQKIKFLLSLVEVMAKEEGESGLGKLERAELESTIQKTYEEVKRPRLSDLRERLLQHSDLEIRKIGRILGPWCGETPFGRFIDRETTIALEKPIVCFDLKGLESLPDLQATFLFIITDFVWREVQADRTSMKFLIFDECWKLLENESGAQFIAEVFRTFRKYMASAIAISQNIDDFARSKVATAILPNASIRWILKQKGADQERLREVLGLNENEAGLIGSIHQEKGVYSEAFLMAEDQRAMVVIESTPLEYWLATTDPRDLSEIDRESKANPQLGALNVLKSLATRFPNGVASKGG